MKELFIDIETRPGIDIDQYVESHEYQAPSSYKKEEAIEKNIAMQKAGARDKVIKEASLSPLYGRICCIGLSYDDKHQCKSGTDEKEILEWFDFYMRNHIAEHKLVTYYGKTFDVPFINFRARANGIGQIIAETPKYTQDYHFDVKEYITNFNGFGKGNTFLMHSQGAVAKALGMPARDIDGSCVYPLYEQGKFNEIEAYCLGDVAALQSIYYKLGLATTGYKPMPF